MLLPVPSLDDRRFQDIVDELKRLIPRYCPEWTDHNVSDPGVALIELFAYLTDLLLYRVNQVPDKMYVTFLEMLGLRLAPPRPAQVPVTFYLSAAQPLDVVLPADTEVATVRTETSPAIVFATERRLTLRPPRIVCAFTREARRGENASWLRQDLAQLALPGRRIPLFSPEQPLPGDAFYLGFENELSDHILALVLDCEVAGGAGVDPTNPPLVWQVWTGGMARWSDCAVEFDGTGGFNQSGEIILHLPPMAQGSFQETNAFWLRCRLTEAQASAENRYRVSPHLQKLRVETRGGTVSARHAITITNEALGISDGTPGQTFRLANTPVLARNPTTDFVVVEAIRGGTMSEPEVWNEVADFADSRAEDRHYILDPLDGTITLGPALLQPNGTVYQFGAVPPKESPLRFSRYQSGGGVNGNIPVGALGVVKSAIPYITRVTNRKAAFGGLNAQSLDDAKLRVPQLLRTRTRAVTADDFEHLASQVVGVARARCLAPGEQSPGTEGLPRPGEIILLILPEAAAQDDGRIASDALTLSAELRTQVSAFLQERRLPGSRLEVRAPRYLFVSVEARLRFTEDANSAVVAESCRQAERALYRYLSPYPGGGPKGEGWPFGRTLQLYDLQNILQHLPLVEFVEEVQFRVDGAASGAETTRLSISPDTVLCSGLHRVTTF